MRSPQSRQGGASVACAEDPQRRALQALREPPLHLRDGAAAIYGADAVAGVVNTVLRDDMNSWTMS